jgi:GH18 family chitinase
MLLKASIHAILTKLTYQLFISHPKQRWFFLTYNGSSKLEQIVSTARGHNVRVSISVGGWGWDTQFEELAAKPESRAAFVQSLSAFVDESQLAGADIDWDIRPSSQSTKFSGAHSGVAPQCLKTPHNRVFLRY